MLIDTGAALNTVNLVYFLVLLEDQELVGEFIQCVMNTEYNAVQLIVAIDLHMNKWYTDLGKMTTVNQNRTPYSINNHDPLLTYFV